MIQRAAPLFVLLLLLGAAPPVSPPIPANVVYRHASLIDGTGRPIQHDMAVLTDGDRISAILADAGLTAKELQNRQSVDLTGEYLLPGYIDSHQHLATPPDRAEAEARLKRDVSTAGSPRPATWPTTFARSRISPEPRAWARSRRRTSTMRL